MDVHLADALCVDELDEVLGVMIWYLWDNGNINSVGALGIMLMSIMFVLAIIMRMIGFSRQRAVGTGI